MTATIVVSRPFEEDVEPQTYEFQAGLSLAEALMEISPDRWGGLTFEVYCGAITVDAARPAASAPDITLLDGDLYHIVVLPAEPVSAAAITFLTVYVGVTAATIIVYIAMTAISMAISFGLSMLLAPGKQKDRPSSAADTPTSLNTLTAPRNTMRPLSRVPDIYGSMRHWPDLIMPGLAWWTIINTGQPPAFVENKDTTSEQFVESVYCVGRGAYRLSNLRFGDSDISTQNGTAEAYGFETPIPASVKLGVSVVNLSRLELGKPGASNQWSPWFDIASNNVDEIAVQIAWPSGALEDLNGKKVVPPSNVLVSGIIIRIEAERLDEFNNVIDTATSETELGICTRNEIRHTFRLTGISRGRWRARVADIARQPWNPFNNGNVAVSNKKGYLEGMIGLVTLDEDDRTFEHETILVVRANNRGGQATQNLETFNLLATRALPTQDFTKPPGQLTPAQPTNDWIAAAIHTLRDPFLCNYQVSEIDWQSLVDVHNSLASYADPETEFNGIFDRQMSADEQLQQIARKARAMAFMSSGRITFARDERRAGMSALFNRRNRMLDRGSVGLGLRFPGPDEHDGVEITWFDEDNDYRQQTLTYPFGVSLINALSIDLVGATKAHEICRRARFEYYAQLYRRRTQPLRVTEEAQLLLPFDRVGIVAPWDEGVVDGEVLEIGTTPDTYRLDRPLPADLPPTARIRLRAPDGRETSLHSISLSNVGDDWCVISPAPSFVMVVPGPDRQIGTLYNISRDDNVDAASTWMVTGAEIDDQGVTLTLSEDADEVYQFSDDVTDPCVETQPPDPPNPVVAAFQWRVWGIGGTVGTVGEGNQQWANIEMATSPGGPDIARTGTTTGVTIASSVVNNENSVFDGNPNSTASTNQGDLLWVGKVFPAKTLLAEVRVQAANSFISATSPQIIVVQSRDNDTDPWKTVHVTVDIPWVPSEFRTFAVASTYRPRGESSALAWRIRWDPPNVGGMTELRFDGIPNTMGQAYARGGYATKLSRRAFDGDPDTDYNDTAAGDYRVGQVLATPANASPTSITITGFKQGTAVSWAPTEFDVEWSDDLEVWSHKAHVTMDTWTGPPALTQTRPI